MVRVRPARPDDAAAVAVVHVRSWQAAYRGLMPDDYLDGLRSEDRQGRYTFGLSDPDAPATVVAEVDGIIRGFATTGPARDDDAGDQGELFGFYVDPDVWGQGIGRLLMARARDRLVGRGWRSALLWVLVGNSRAERFYAADGWVADGEKRTDEVWGVIVEETRYRRRLP
ncbi:MAG: GNAT family N-acetyltransferase [Acidimicrobiales bacterium]